VTQHAASKADRKRRDAQIAKSLATLRKSEGRQAMRLLGRFALFNGLFLMGGAVGMLVDLSYRTGWRAPDIANMGQVIGGNPIGAAIGAAVGALSGALLLVFMDRKRGGV